MITTFLVNYAIIEGSHKEQKAPTYQLIVHTYKKNKNIKKYSEESTCFNYLFFYYVLAKYVI